MAFASVLSEYSSFLPQFRKMKGVRLISDFKLDTGVNVSANGCLALCVNHLIDWQPAHSVHSPIYEQVGGCSLVQPRTGLGKKTDGQMDEWMDGQTDRRTDGRTDGRKDG